MPNWCYQQLQIRTDRKTANTILNDFSKSFKDGPEYINEPPSKMLTVYNNPDGSVAYERMEWTEAHSASDMTGIYKPRKVPNVMPFSQEQAMQLMSYNGNDPADVFVDVSNPEYKNYSASKKMACITWRSKWIPSYCSDNMVTISNAYPNVTFVYNSVERASGIMMQYKVMNGQVEKISNPQDIMQAFLSSPDMQRLHERSG